MATTMAGERVELKFLSTVLSQSEVELVPQDIREKLEALLDSRETIEDGLKTKLEKLRVNSEQRYFELEKKLIASSTKLESSLGSINELKTQNAKLEEQLSKSKEELSGIRDSSEGSLLSYKQLSRSVELLEYEKGELLKVLERKNQEINRLNEDWRSMSGKLAEANSAKCSMQARVDELQGHDISIKYREKRLEQEKTQLTSQNEWLSQQLKTNTDQLLQLRKEKSNQILELQGQLNERLDELNHIQETVETYRKTNTDQEARIEELMTRMKENNDAYAQSEEQFRGELQSQARLASLYEKGASEAQDKVRELITAVEELQKLLGLASTSHDELKAQLQKMDAEYSGKEKDLTDKMVKMEKELEDANDLLDAARKKGVALRISDEELNSLSPTAAAASSFLKSGLTLTQMYSEYVKSSDELEIEKAENQRLNSYLDQILVEIEEKAPIMQKQREDYEKALQATNQMSARLDANLVECEQLRITADEAERRANMAAREIIRLKQQCTDLGHQVRVLLKEVQEARGGPIGAEMNVSSSDVSSSSGIISQHLVSFRSIEELQSQNEKLLASLRELSDRKEQEEQLTVESKTAGLKQQLDSALQDIEEMRDARTRQTEMVEAIVRQRDMYRVLLEQSGTTPPPASLIMSASPLTSPAMLPQAAPTTTATDAPDSQPSTAQGAGAKDTAGVALKTLQEEFETYRKEKAQNGKLLNEQLDQMRKEVSDFRVQNAQLNSQLDFAGERFKILQSNVDGYKKEIATLRDKINKYSAADNKNQQKINTLTQDLMAANEKLTRAEVGCDNLRAERDLLKGVEARLNQEKESMLREHRSQTILLTNLETIQNNLERSEFESKARLSNQMEGMSRELNMLRRRLEGENDQHRVVLKTWESRVQSVQRQLNHELENHQKTRESLNKTKSELQNMKEQCSSVEAQLVAAQIKYESALKDKNDALASRSQQTVVVSSNEEEVRELKTKLRMTEDQVKVLKDQIEKSKIHLEQYKSISAAIETSLKEQSLASQTFKESMEKRLEETTQAREQLEKQVIDLTKERNSLQSEKEELGEAVASQTSALRRNLVVVQEELTLAVQQKSDAETNEAAARQDCQEQAKLAKEAQDKYEREFLLHAADVQQLVTVKEQLESQNTKLMEAEEIAKKAQDTLTSSKVGWEEQSRIQMNELEEQARMCRELNQQNTLLHQQLEELSQRMISSPQRQRDAVHVQARVPDENKSSEQLLEVIKFLRREKEIAETRSELAQSECLRIKQKCEHLERQYEETHRNLTGERERTQVMAQTTAKHQELLKKVETLNALTDSNRMLREEKDRLEQQVQQLEAKVNQLEADIQPLQEQNRSLTVERDCLSADKIGLTIEVTRWKQRTNHLIEQCNRADPEEQKKLIAEKDANKKTIGSLREENLRHKAELSRINAQLTAARNEISKLNTDFANMQSEMKLEQSKLSEEINTLKMDVTAKETDINDKKNTIQQVKKIGRRYKAQYEELQAKVDAEKEQQGQPSAETEAKIKELEEANAKLTEEIKTVKEAEEKTKSQLSEKDERDEKSKKLIQGMRQKLSQVNTERNRANEEKSKLQATVDELKGELSAMESLHSQSEGQMETDKKQLQEKVEQLEKDLKQSKEKQEKLQVIQREEQQKQQLQKSELQTRVQELERQVEEQQKQLQIKHLAPQQPIGAERPSARSEEPPPTANIKPISSPAQTVSKTSMPSSQRMTASVRPIAVTPVTSALSSASATPMATVMPQTQSEASTVVMESDRQQAVQEPLSVETPIVISVPSTTPIQAVTPTQQAPPTVAAYYPHQVPEPRMEGVPDDRAEPTQQQQQQQQEVVRADNVQEVRAEPRIAPAAEQIAEVPAEQPEVEAVPDQSGDVFLPDVESRIGQEMDEDLEEVQKPSSSVSRTDQSNKRQREETDDEDELTQAEETRNVEKRLRVTPQPQLSEELEQSSPSSGDAQAPAQADGVPKATQQSSMSPSLGEDEAGMGISVQPSAVEADEVPPTQEGADAVEETSGTAAPSGGEWLDEASALPAAEGEVGGEGFEETGEEEEQEQEEDEDDDDDVVIVVDSDDDELADDEDQSPEDHDDAVRREEDDGDGEAEDYEEDEDYDEYPVEGDIEYGDEEDDDDEDDIDEDMEDEDDGEEPVSMEEPDDDGGDTGNEQDMDDDEVVEISEDEEAEGAENDMEVGSTGQQEHVQPMEDNQTLRVPMPELRVDPPGADQVPTSQGGESQIERVPFQHSTVPRQRLASLGRAPMFLGAGAPFEDFGDDRQVPSTPTLFVPRRTDGFAEAINSPLLQGRFNFGGTDSEQSRSMAPALAQLATQGDLGLDDTRINLLGGDEDGGRSVPTTPLQTHAPATVLTSSPSSQAQDSSPASQDTSRSVPATSEATQQQQQLQQAPADQDEPDTLPNEVPQSSPAVHDTSSEEQTGAEPQGVPQGDELSGTVPTSESSESRDRQEQGSSESGQGERPKPKRIVWQDSPGSSQSQQRPQQSRGGTAIRSRGRFIQRSFPRGAGNRGRGARFPRGRGQPPF